MNISKLGDESHPKEEGLNKNATQFKNEMKRFMYTKRCYIERDCEKYTKYFTMWAQCRHQYPDFIK